MDVLIGQAPLIAFLVFYYFYGARLVGALLAAAWRPIRGLEARPIYWEGGIAALFVVLGLWGAARLPPGAPFGAVAIMAGFAVMGGFMALDWRRRRLWLEGQALRAEAVFARPVSLPLTAIKQAHLSGGFSLVLERADGAPPIRAPLSMDGLDAVYAALLRAGVPGPSFEAFQAARKSQRRR